MPMTKNQYIERMISTQQETLEKIKAHPSMAPIRAKLECDKDFKFSEYVPLFENMLKSGFLQHVIDVELNNLKNFPDYQLRNFSSETRTKGWQVLETKDFVINVGIGTRTPEEVSYIEWHKSQNPGEFQSKLTVTPKHFYMGFALIPYGSNHIEFVVPEWDENNPPSPNEKLKFVRERQLQNGDSIYLKSGEGIPAVTYTGKIVYLEVAGKNDFSFSPVYCLETLKLDMLVGTDEQASRIELLTRHLINVEAEESIETVEKASKEHSHHHIRWSLMECLYKLSPEKGIQRLKDGLTDPHIHIRNASALALNTISQEKQNAN
ncbi:hypothetical protein [Alteromonas gilva]|uniref:HEAT repeat domain-containing protein n=1 Tax=Alteromonas gilva TaxID=2987522 RepID=A0ABT5L8S7_9ALTE|nr:hypothetical protein [Alteromonas gilva]MDC8832896.1 hypothetical protein [Alteromonas gilva]